RMISVFGRHLVGSEASVERIDLFLRLDLGLTGRDILAGEDYLTSGNIRFAVDANTEKQAERYQRRLRRWRYPHAMAKDHCKAVHQALRYRYIGLALCASRHPLCQRRPTAMVLE